MRTLNMGRCHCCGMYCKPTEYHPYAACMMFKLCKDSDEVRANLQAVIDHGAALSRSAGQEKKENPHG
jgi:hypothetical protein